MNLEKLIRPSVLKLRPYSSAREEFSGIGEIFLDANESPYGQYSRYPDPNQGGLKKRIAAIKCISEKNIFIGNGSDEVIDLVLRVFCQPQHDKALCFFPSYGMYEVSAAINEVELIQLPLDSNFQIDLNSLDQYLKDPYLKVIFLCSPNNPSGNILQGVRYILSKFEGIVVLDEAYIDFSSTTSFLSVLNEYPNLIVMQTLSKAFGMAGLRLGMAFASQTILSYLNKLKPPYNVSKPNQELAVTLLLDLDRIKGCIEEIKHQRSWLAEELKKLVVKVYPSEANFLLVEVKDANKIYEQLLGQGIVTRNRNGVVRNCIRITVGTPFENQRLVAALKQIL